MKEIIPAHQVMIQLLGTGTIRTEQNLACSSSLIFAEKSRILIDCGPGCILRLHESGILIREINHIFITHFHPDHISDLIPLLFAFYHTSSPKNSIEVWGPSGLNNLLQNLIRAYGQWISSPLFIFHELKENELIHSDFKINWFKVYHNEESIGYRFQIGSKIISFSGDSGYCPELIELSKNADLAIFECSFPDSQSDPFHLNPSAVAKIATVSGAKKIILTHMYPEVLVEKPRQIIQEIYRGRVLIGKDLDKYFP
jgi:ribonuclease BN (tRNA processing enzyme)